MNLDIFFWTQESVEDVEDMAWFLTASYSKMQEEKDKEEESLVKRKSGLDEIVLSCLDCKRHYC